MRGLLGGLRWPGAALVAAAGILAAGQLVLPGVVENRIVSALSRSLGDGGSVRADVKAFPALQLLGGRIDSVDLDLRRVAVGDLMVDALLVEGRDVVLDMGRLLAGEGVRVADAESLNGTLIVVEDDLNDYFKERVEGLTSFRIALEPGKAVITGGLAVVGREFAVRVAGEFRVDGGTSISFVPVEARIENSAVPQFALMLIASEWPLRVAFDQDVVPLAVEDLVVEDGRLVIYGSRPADRS